MSDLICKNTGTRCQSPGMCSPFGGCREVEPVSSVWLEQLRSAFRQAVLDRDRLIAENKHLSALLECSQGDMRQAQKIMDRDMKDAERYRYVSDLAWYVERGAQVYDLCNVNARWSSDRGSPDRDDIEEAVDAAMAEELQ